MNFDRLDESYAMVRSNLHFDKFTLTGLTGLCIPVRPVCTAVPILIVNTMYSGKYLCRIVYVVVHFRPAHLENGKGHAPIHIKP